MTSTLSVAADRGGGGARSSFEGADLTDADLSDAYLGDFESRALCRNPNLAGTNPVTGSAARLRPPLRLPGRAQAGAGTELRDLSLKRAEGGGRQDLCTEQSNGGFLPHHYPP